MIHCFWVLALLLTVSIVTCNGIIVSTTLQIFGMWDQITNFCKQTISKFANFIYDFLPISNEGSGFSRKLFWPDIMNFWRVIIIFLYISWDWCIYLEKCLYFRAGRTLEGVSAMVRRHNLFFRIYCCLNKAPKY